MNRGEFRQTASDDTDSVTKPIMTISMFNLPSAALLLTLSVSTSFAADPLTITNEHDLIAILQSAAPPQEKAITCKRLAVYGSEAAVPI